MSSRTAQASSVLVPEYALAAGFSNSPGTHTGKSMMLAELRLLLAGVPGPAEIAQYQTAVLEENVLGKSTAANRANTFRNMKQLYGLRPDLPVFAAMREMWHVSRESQPVLALLCSSARDLLLRTTANTVLGASLGTVLGGVELSAVIAVDNPGRYSPSTQRNLGQNITSSWIQAGFLSGGRELRRVTPEFEVPAVVYALYLGHLERVVGPSLFTTRWARILDRPERDLRTMVEAASRSGWLEYRSSGGMTEITFNHLDTVTGWKAS